MSSQEDIRHQQTLLKINRSRLKVLIEQQTTMGTFTPPYIRLEIDSARTQIREIKRILSSWNVTIEDLAGDEPPSDAHSM
jgi:archaellum component FlaC